MKTKPRYFHELIQEAMVKPVPMVEMLVRTHGVLAQGNTVMVPVRDETGKQTFQPLEIV